MKHVVVNASLCSVKIDKDHCEKLYCVKDTTLKMSDEEKKFTKHILRVTPVVVYNEEIRLFVLKEIW